MSDYSQLQDTAQQDEWLRRPVLKSWHINIEQMIYILILIVAIATRFWGIGDRVVSHDESLHTQYSYQYFNGDGYQHTPLMHGPSLFHLTALSYWLFGDTDATARLPVAILGVILVLLPYLLRDWLGGAGAIVSSIILLISPYITYYSRYIRHDIIIITFATILFISIIYYLKEQKDKYIWWFAFGMAMMFTTMETSFIYVAIFGSFLVLALLTKILTSGWIRESIRTIRTPLLLSILAILLFLAGFAGERFVPRVFPSSEIATETATEEGFAADPSQILTPQAESDQGTTLETVAGWLQVSGLIVLALGLFLTAKALRPNIDRYPEFDLVILFTTLTLPTATAFMIVLAGGDPLSYTLQTCQLAGQETMSAFQLFFARAFNPTCLSAFASSPIVLSAIFLIITFVASTLVGIWWNRKRWIIAALIYHGIFLLLFTSLFSNPTGWASGMIGSLGYWLEQQEVQRANQPSYFYFIVLPLYEFLPLLLTLLAAHLWAKKNKLDQIVDYWIAFILLAILANSLTNYFFNRNKPLEEANNGLPGLIAAGIIIIIGIIIWIVIRRRQIKDTLGLEKGFSELFIPDALFGFVPYLIWWFLASWLVYSLAGEKMAWLSSHFIMPMVLLGGWYINQLLITADLEELRSRRFGLLLLLAILTLLSIFLAFSPVLLGQLQLGEQSYNNLTGIGRFLGTLLVAAVMLYFLRKVALDFSRDTLNRAIVFAVCILLGLLTVRANFTASFRNADYVTEFMVYAHGAPATKSEVLSQLEDLSMRTNGDKGIRVAFDNDSSWPFTWYLRDYPNRQYFGENPDGSIRDAPVVIVGSQNWTKVEPLLGDDFEENTYTFLWWPMEEYRKLSWNAFFGDPNVEPEFRRGIFNADVRQALWDIFFYRDYEKYGEVYGGTYTAGEWPLRHDLRMFIKKDTLATIWDHGAGAITYEPPVDLYAENDLDLEPILVVGTAGADQGQLAQPRNLAIGTDNNIYVVDTGNHRVQVFDEFGQVIRTWGEFGNRPGQFNEPWGIAVDDSSVYVADTWNHRVQKFTLTGDFVAEFGQSGSPVEGDTGGGLFFGPRGISVTSDGKVLVTDTGNHRIQVFDRDGDFLQAIGNQGALPGQFNEPVGLALGESDAFYVADTWNSRIQKFSPIYLPESEWQIDGWFSQSLNNKPYLAVDQQEHIYVTDPEGFRVLVFDNLGNYLARFGKYSTDLDGFALPNGIATDTQGNIYIADAGNSRILKFAPLSANLQPIQSAE